MKLGFVVSLQCALCVYIGIRSSFTEPSILHCNISIHRLAQGNLRVHESPWSKNCKHEEAKPNLVMQLQNDKHLCDLSQMEDTDEGDLD